jgi:hypothetical protein
MRRVAVLGAAALDGAAIDDADEIVVLDPSPAALLDVLADVQDARYAFLLGELPVLPLPDAWVDDVVGADADADDDELARIRR